MNMCLCYVHLFLIYCEWLLFAFPGQLSDQLSVTRSLPTFNFLGSLLEAVPDVAHSLVTQYGETL